MNLHKKKQSGQGMVEYALILALIAVVVIVAVSVVGTNASTKMSSVAASIIGGGGAVAVASFPDTYFFLQTYSTEAGCTWTASQVWGNGAHGVGCYMLP